MGPRIHFASVLFAAVVLEAAQDPTQLPEGKGREAVAKVCTGCHEIATVTESRRTRSGWQANVDGMISRGAEGTDEEMAAVIEYLTRNFGKINVNAAAARELQSSLGISGKEAQAIITYREQIGNYKDFEQLKKTPGIDGDKLQAKKSQIAFSR